ncbi:MAG: hypothetical protein LBL95_07090 [Deltaproteobacteria bacterium]|jgi:predicted DNA-binding protein (MmcQ/YjbR family)|nr:hypothetical protein [Deltaproteobacteria bacterium]
MKRLHWNSLFLGGTVPDDVVRGMIDESFPVVFLSLPKKTQLAIRPMTSTA